MSWLRIDGDLRVVEASAAALESFDNPALPNSLIAFTRAPEIESRAREILEGGTGPWEVEAANFGRVFRLRGIDLGADGALLHLEDITDVGCRRRAQGRQAPGRRRAHPGEIGQGDRNRLATQPSGSRPVPPEVFALNNGVLANCQLPAGGRLP